MNQNWLVVLVEIWYRSGSWQTHYSLINTFTTLRVLLWNTTTTAPIIPIKNQRCKIWTHLNLHKHSMSHSFLQYITTLSPVLGSLGSGKLKPGPMFGRLSIPHQTDAAHYSETASAPQTINTHKLQTHIHTESALLGISACLHKQLSSPDSDSHVNKDNTWNMQCLDIYLLFLKDLWFRQMINNCRFQHNRNCWASGILVQAKGEPHITAHNSGVQ